MKKTSTKKINNNQFEITFEPFTFILQGQSYE